MPPAVVELAFSALLDGHKIGPFVLDPDGEVMRDEGFHRKFLAPGVMLVVDDYEAARPNERCRLFAARSPS